MSHCNWGCSFIWVDLYRRHCRGRKRKWYICMITNRYQLKQKAYHTWEKGIYTYSLQRLSTLHNLPSRWMLLTTHSQSLYSLSSLNLLFLLLLLFFFLKGWSLGFVIKFLLRQRRECHWLQRETRNHNAVFSNNLKKSVTWDAYALSPKYFSFL